MPVERRSEPKLAFILQDLRGGGAERAVVRLVNGMVLKGFPLDLVVLQKQGVFLEELDPQVNVIDLRRARTLTGILGLRNYIETARPACIVATMTHINVATVLARMASRHKPRIVLVEHNQIERNFVRTKGAVRAAYRAVPFLYRRADVIAAVSEGVRTSIAAKAGVAREMVRVLYNPVVTADLFERAAEPVNHPWLLDKSTPVLLAVGRLMRLKNFALLLDAFAQLRRTQRARLIILGEGELRPDLERQIARLGIGPDVDLAGFRPNPFAYMKRSDVFVLSSDWEGHPTVLIEAMACGAPIVATDCVSGPAEILENGRYGQLVEPGNATKLAQAIEKALADPGLKEPRIEHARTFNVDRAVANYLRAAGLPQFDASQSDQSRAA